VAKAATRASKTRATRQPDEQKAKSRGRARPESRADKRPSKPVAEGLGAYRAKRDFDRSPEPKGRKEAAAGDRFCVQKHDARRLHYDLRLELDGVLKSWAVTRGPSLVVGDKRLAVHTEDHPLEYLTFEGVIPKGEYGGGTMIVWDRGRWIPEGDPRAGYKKGHLAFTLEGERLHGRWHLVRTRPKPGQKREQWLLLKADDEFARPPEAPAIIDEEITSVISGRSNDDLAREGEVRADHADRAEAAAGREAPAPDLTRIPGARKGILPVFVEPCLATLVDKAPSGPEWVHEIKFDGYRLQARIDGGKVKLLTRKGLDWTSKFKRVAEALKKMRLGAALIDGEVVVETESGVSSFSGLQEALKEERPDRMVFYGFDLLYLDGVNLTRTPLVDRKTLLAGLLDDAPAGGAIRYSDHIDIEGQEMLRHACRLGLEGIISKRRDLPYRSGRRGDWLKTKCTARQEFVIAGYVPSTTVAKAIGALVLAVYENGRLVHVGKVGTGYTEATARKLWAELDKIKRPTSPFPDKLPRIATNGVRWVEPKLVAEVELRGWSADGLIRHGSFKGLRDDKNPEEVVRESGQPQRAPLSRATRRPDFTLTHPDRVLWEDLGLTKQGLADFYVEIADWILPHIVDRPLSLVRCPAGYTKECFFQKHAWAGLDTDLVRPVRMGEDEGLAIGDLRGLLALVQAGVLEIHPWGATVADPERPDRITFDLDPDDSVSFQTVIASAQEVRERLAALSLESFVKTTGGKGLHVVVPLTPKAGWEEVKAFADEFATRLAADHPDRYTANMAKRARAGRIFVDYLRNTRGATAIGAYSTRARAGAPVSAPLGWDELPALQAGNQYRVENLLRRLDHLRRDPWQALSAVRQMLPATPTRRKLRKRA
jgi:bifunctional non-homologous end joining protein LigD